MNIFKSNAKSYMSCFLLRTCGHIAVNSQFEAHNVLKLLYVLQSRKLKNRFPVTVFTKNQSGNNGLSSIRPPMM